MGNTKSRNSFHTADQNLLFTKNINNSCSRTNNPNDIINLSSSRIPETTQTKKLGSKFIKPIKINSKEINKTNQGIDEILCIFNSIQVYKFFKFFFSYASFIY